MLYYHYISIKLKKKPKKSKPNQNKMKVTSLIIILVLKEILLMDLNKGERNLYKHMTYVTLSILLKTSILTRSSFNNVTEYEH